MKRVIKMLAVAGATLAAAVPAGAQMRAEVHGGIDRAGGPGLDTWGEMIGAAVGYDAPLANGRAFIGVEADADYARTRDCRTGYKVAGDRLCGRAGADLSGVVRIGARPSATSAVYLLGGYTRGHVRTTYTSGALSSRSSDDLDGLRLGIGTEFALGAKAYGKVEYRYSNYEQRFIRHQGLVGIGVRF